MGGLGRGGLPGDDTISGLIVPSRDEARLFNVAGKAVLCPPPAC